MQNFIALLGSYEIAGLTLLNVTVACAAALGSYILMLAALRLLTGRLDKVADRTTTRIDDIVVHVLAGTNRWLLALAAVLIGVSLLELAPRWNERLNHLWFIALAVQVGLWMTRAIAIAISGYEVRHNGRNSAQPTASATLLSWFLRTVLWAVILLAVLSNLGVNITAFVASLGVGGIAVALAVQNILGDLFASLAIAVDKPFEVGDFIASDAGMGTVEYVGLKTTRIRSLTGEQIVVANTDLLKQPVKNYRRMEQRRIAFKFGITYDTPPQLVEAVPGIVQRLVESDEMLRFDRAHFAGFGDSSLDFEVVYFVRDPGYNVYMDAQQRINLGLLREFAARGIDFAFPTRTLYLAGSGGPAEVSRLPEAANG